jgi:glutamate-ammonia-ligase adenylyltransferase
MPPDRAVPGGGIRLQRVLSEAVLQSPEWLEELAESRGMERVLAAEEFEDLLEAELAAASSGARLAFALAVFRRRQLLRIVLRDVLNLATLPEITEELSNLAAAILEVSYRRLRVELERRLRRALLLWTAKAGSACVTFSVIGVGQAGGAGAELQLPTSI